MNDLKVQIEIEASRAAQLSKEAVGAFAVRNLAQGRALMKQAVDAGRNCQSLIQKYNQTLSSPSRFS